MDETGSVELEDNQLRVVLLQFSNFESTRSPLLISWFTLGIFF